MKQDWSAQSVHISARSRFQSAAMSSVVRTVLTWAWVSVTASRSSSGTDGRVRVPGRAAQVPRRGGTGVVEGPNGWSWEPS